MESPQAKQQELFSIWLYLAKQLRMFHIRGRYLRDVTLDNVVQVGIGNSHGWSMLEFARVAKDKRDIDKATVPARTVPPEVCSLALLLSSKCPDTEVDIESGHDSDMCCTSNLTLVSHHCCPPMCRLQSSFLFIAHSQQ